MTPNKVGTINSKRFKMYANMAHPPFWGAAVGAGLPLAAALDHHTVVTKASGW
jgi:hypothetical protein